MFPFNLQYFATNLTMAWKITSLFVCLRKNILHIIYFFIILLEDENQAFEIYEEYFSSSALGSIQIDRGTQE